MITKILVTGAAGFIGFHLAEFLLAKGYQLVGIDNINDYYDQGLKYARLSESGIERDKISDNIAVISTKYPNYKFIKLDISQKDALFALFEAEKFDYVCNLAAQAGVRYSLTHSQAYIDANITGFLNVLEACRFYPVKHLLYASSSSVYGLNQEQPYTTEQKTDNPISVYAATKKMNELLAHTYSHLYKIHTTGLRFFTVYGPWGRPDMAPILFAKAITEKKPINIYNQGNMYRDFTYIGDLVKSIFLLMDSHNIEDNNELYQIYNIGNSKSVHLMEFISELENKIGIEAVKKYLPLQQGDMISTLADASALENRIGYRPDTPISIGISKFVDWFLNNNGL
jgi:UDP-glucuronate 4-epimerase